MKAIQWKQPSGQHYRRRVLHSPAPSYICQQENLNLTRLSLGSNFALVNGDFTGGTGLKFESWKVQNHIQTASQYYFLLLSGRNLNHEIQLQPNSATHVIVKLIKQKIPVSDGRHVVSETPPCIIICVLPCQIMAMNKSLKVAANSSYKINLRWHESKWKCYSAYLGALKKLISLKIFLMFLLFS